ncbi:MULTISPECIES: class III lanthipeptide [unclassified Streptomyces]|nr:class III lanthipeptide [Streptomyces sp. NBC_01477]
MSVLNLQTMEPIAVESAVAVLSTTSSSSDCCKKPSKPGV